MKTEYLIFLGLAAAGVYFLGRAGKFAGAAAGAINPVNNDNIFAAGVNAVGDVLDDGASDGSFSLGASIYNVLHRDEWEAMKKGVLPEGF